MSEAPKKRRTVSTREPMPLTTALSNLRCMPREMIPSPYVFVEKQKNRRDAQSECLLHCVNQEIGDLPHDISYLFYRVIQTQSVFLLYLHQH